MALLTFILPVHASKMDDRIELSAKKSYVFKTYLKDDDIKIQSKDGAVTLTGTVSDESHKSLARETVAGLPRGQDALTTGWKSKGKVRTANSDAWLVDESENHALVPSQRERHLNRG